MKYIRLDVVDAEPTTRGEYYNSQGLRIPEEEDPFERGYAVYYRKGEPCEQVSWRSKAEFDSVSRQMNGMTFGMALEAMKRGRRAARMGWNGRGMWLSIPLADGPKDVPASDVCGRQNEAYARRNGGKVKVMPYITMKSADGSVVVGWLASQTDMLAEDWYLIADETEDGQ